MALGLSDSYQNELTLSSIMKAIKFSGITVAIIASLLVFGATSVFAQQAHPVKKSEPKVKPVAPVKENPEVEKDSTAGKKAPERKGNKMMPKAKPPGK